MFVQNQIRHLNNHKDVIIAEMQKADQMLFVVAYVRENGVDVILEKIKDKPTKLLCSLDMGITQLSGIEKLLANNVEVKVYKSYEGTFHPKIWLFGKNKKWKMLIGSANLTRAAFVDNVEASVLVEDQDTTSNALMFFNYLWDKENSSTISKDEIISLKNKINERKAFKNKSAQITQAANSDDTSKIDVLLEYTKNWIDIPKYASKGISTLWRGWYVIPDQGLINDQKIQHLKSYLPFIKNDLLMGKNFNDKNYNKLLDQFKKDSQFQRKNLKTSMHGLFVRQAKNYLIKFGWCYHPINNRGKIDKKVLSLTDLGRHVAQCQNLESVKILYTDYFSGYLFNGLAIVQFTKKLLQRLDYLDINEFNYFVTHAYNDDDLETIVDLVKVYRSLSTNQIFRNKFSEYFHKIKEPTAHAVYSNYTKSIRHTVSAIGWCDGFSLNDDFVLRLSDAK